MSKRSIGVMRVLIIAALLGVTQLAQAQVRECYAAASGNWSAAATWNCGAGPGDGPPDADDNVHLQFGPYTVTLGANAVAGTIDMTPGTNGDSNTIDLNGFNLDVTGAITWGACCSTGETPTINVGSGTLSAASISMNGDISAGYQTNLLSVGTGTVNLSNGFTFAGDASNNRITYTGAGRLEIGGNFPSGATLTTAANMVVDLNGTAPQSLGDYTLYHLDITGGGGVSLSGSMLDLDANLNVSAASTFNIGSASPATVSGSLTVNGTLTSAFTTLTLDGSATTIDGTGSITNTILDIQANHTIPVLANLTVDYDISLAGGVNVTNNGTLTGAAIYASAAGASWTNNGTLNVTGNLFPGANGTFTSNSASVVNLTGGCAVCSIGPGEGGFTFYDLVMSRSDGNVRINAPIVINHDLDIQGGAFEDGSNQITGPGATAGTLTIGATGALFLGNGQDGGATTSLPVFQTYAFDPESLVAYIADGSTQQISAIPTYGHLRISTGELLAKSRPAQRQRGATRVQPASDGSKTIVGDTTLDILGDLELINAGAYAITFNMESKTVNVDGDITGTGNLTIGSSGTLSVGGDYSNSGVLTTTVDSTVVYNGTPAEFDDQQVKSATYHNLTIGTVGPATMSGGAITVNGSMAIAAGSTLRDAGYSITGNAGGSFTMGDGSFFEIQNLGFPSGFGSYTLSATSTVEYRGATGQIINATPTYGFLIVDFNCAGCSVAATGNVTTQKDLTLSCGDGCGTLDMGANNLTVGGDLLGGGFGHGALAFTTGNLTIGGSYLNAGTYTAGVNTVTYNGTSGTFTVRSDISYANLAIEGAGGTFQVSATPATITNLDVAAGTLEVPNGATLQVSNNVNVDGVISTPLSGILQMTSPAGGTLTGSGGMLTTLDVAADKTFNTTGLNVSGAVGGNGIAVGPAVTVTNNGDITAYAIAAADSFSKWINITGSSVTVVGDLFPTLGVLDASAADNTVIYANNGPNTVKGTTYHHLTLTTSGVKTLQTGVVVNGTLYIDGAVSTTFIESMTIGGDFYLGPTATIDLGTFSHSVGGNWDAPGTEDITGSTVSFTGTGKTINAGTFDNVAFNGDTTLIGDLSVIGDLTINSTLNGGAVAINLDGDWNQAGIFFADTSTVTLDGAAAQSISGTSNFNNLTINNATGVTTAANVSIAGNLTLTSGVLATSGTVFFDNDATVTTGAGYVNGAVEKAVPFGGTVTFTFPVGTASGYAPVKTTATGNVLDVTHFFKVTPAAGAHPLAVGGTNVLQRYWTLDVSGVSSADLTFNYNDAEVVGTEASYVVAKHDGGNWGYPASSINTATNTATANGVTSFSDFTLGEATSLVGYGVVTNTSDSGPGSLRQAIVDANSGACQSPCSIVFNIPTSDSGFAGGVFTIKPQPAGLPNITASGAIVDGATQTSFTGDTNPDGPEVIIDGSLAGAGAHGLIVANTTGEGQGNNIQILNLGIQNFNNTGILLDGQLGWVANCVISNNYIGVTADGNSSAGNFAGVRLINMTSGNTISNNVISGNSVGIWFSENAQGNTIQGNKIGTAADGVSGIPNSGRGITLGQTSTNNLIGGTESGDGNTIAFNGTQGIAIANDSASYGNAIRGNSIYDNGFMGIDLAENGAVEANDPGDGDIGPNNLQNYPVLTSITFDGTNSTISGTIDTTGGAIIAIDFFASATQDPSGSGEGETYLGSTTVTAGAGPTSFSSGPIAGDIRSFYVTATATVSGATQDTSEFSAAIIEVNDAPVNTLVASVTTSEDVVYSFSSAEISISDPDAGASSVEVALSATNGALTFGTTTGLTFSVGDGTADTAMTFQGSIASINTALDSLSYGPFINVNGVGSLSITTNDLGNTGSGGAASDSDTMTINIVAVNDPPTANIDSTSTTEDASVTLDVTINDSDVDGPSLTVTAWTNGANGSVNCSGTNCTYTPNPNFTGTDNFNYTISDGEFTSTSQVFVTISAVNDPPVANADSQSTSEDTAVTTNVVANDVDPDGPSLTIASFTNGTNGTVSCSSPSCTYSPNANFNGTDSYTYTVSDGSSSSTATVTVNVSSVNDAPVANADTFSTAEDTPLIVPVPGVLGNDTDVDGASLTASVISTTAAGTLTLNGDGSFSYTPNANFTGSDTFSYSASDGSLSSSASVTINVAAANDPPVANADTATTSEDASITTAVLSNDTDVDGPSMTISSFTQGANGTVNCTSPNCTYTPNANFNGSDSYTYTITDGTSTSTASVSVTITPVNDAPVANADTYATTEETLLAIAAPGVRGNDTDVDGPSLTTSVLATTTNGSLTLNADGSFTYMPNADFAGSDSFTYQLSDGSLSSSATATITVAATNDPPVANADTQSTNEDTAVTSNVIANDSDPDGPSLTIASFTQGANGTVNCTSPNCTYTPNANFNGSDSYTYTITDGTSTSTASVSVTITPVNDAPVANADTYATTEETLLAIPAPGVRGNDTDVDGPSLTTSVLTTTTNGSLTLNADGSFTYMPNADFAGSDSFTYQLSDGSLSSSATATITVAATNDPPVANADTQSTNEDTAVTTNVIANDSDPDGPSLTIASFTQGANGTVNCTSPNCTYTPNANFNGSDSYTYTISDGSSSSTATVTVTVSAMNDAPVANADTYATTEETLLAIPAPGVRGNDTDVDGPSLTTSVLTTTINGSLTLNADGSFTYMPNADFAGSDSFTYQLSDGSLSSSATATITVAATNDPPVANADTESTNEDTAVTTNVIANDSDPDGPSLTIASFTQGANGTVNCTSPNCTYTPNANFNGSDSYTYTISDGSSSSTATVTVTVSAVNDAPVASADSYSTTEDTPVTISAPGVLLNDADIDGPSLSAVLVGTTTNGALSLSANGSFTYTPNAGFNGVDSFTYQASDGTLSSGTVTVTINVGGVNDPPAAVNDSGTTAAGTPITINVIANDTDPDGDTLSVTSFTQGSNGTVSCTAAACTYTSNAAFSGTDSFTYTISDGNGGTSTATVTITVMTEADLAIGKVDSVDPVFVSTSFTYTLFITNGGPTAASSVVVTDTLPAGVSFVSASGTGWSCSQSSGVVTCTRATLIVGSSTIDIVVTAPSTTGTITNNATITSSTADPNSSNNSISETTTVVAASAVVGNTNDSGPGSLRQAILDANSGACAAPCVIRFNLTPPVPAGGAFVINLVTPLPSIRAYGVVVDGLAQTRATGNTNPNGPEIFINGSGITSPGANGLVIESAGTGQGQDNQILGIGVYGFSGAGFVIQGNPPNVATGNVLAHNSIGPKPSGGSGSGNGTGIVIQNASGNVIGGNVSESNTIAFNLGAGVVVSGSSTDNFITQNSIYGNGGLGIDLNGDGVTLNDSGDGDSGANGLQNFPIITSVLYNASGGDTTVAGTLNSIANTTFAIDIYSNASLDASGYGEGQTYLNTAVATTDVAGNASWSVTVSGDQSSGNLTATATAMSQPAKSRVAVFTGMGTSEFSTTTTGPDISVTKSGPTQSAINASVAFTIQVTNGGGSPANVTLNDPTPVGLTFLSNSGACTSPFPCTLNGIAAGATKTITATYIVNGNAPTSINNTATATLTNATDPTPATNTSSATVLICAGDVVTASPAANATDVPISGTLTWNNTGADEYFVYLGSGAGGCSALLGSTLTPSISYNGLNPGTTYSWKVVSARGGCLVSSACFTFQTAGTPCQNPAPVLLSPANGSSGIAPPATLSWSGVANATGYNVFASINGAAMTLVASTVGASATSATLDAPLGATVAWFVEAQFANCSPVSSAESTFVMKQSEVCDFESPTLIAPANGTQNLTSPLLVDWNGVSGAIGYKVWVGVGDENPFIVASTSAAETSATASVPSGALKVFVQALFEGCPPTVSATHGIAVNPKVVCPTGVPNPILPVQDAVYPSNVEVEFQWTAVPEAIGYALWFSIDGDTASIYGKTDGATTKFKRFVPAGNIEWFVQAIFDGCPPLGGPVRSLTILSPDPCDHDAPRMTSPSNGAQDVASLVTFEWTPVENADEYRLYVKVNGTDPELVGTTDVETTLTVPIRATAASAYVEAHFDGCPLTASTPVSFTLFVPTSCANGAPVLLAPSQSSQQTSRNATFMWIGVPNAIGYEVYTSHNDGGATLLAQVPANETSYQTTLTEGTHVWRVDALFNGCAKTSSPEAIFSIQPPPLCEFNAPTLVAPADGLSELTSPVQLVWNPVPGATGYRVWTGVDGADPQRRPNVLTATSTTLVLATGTYAWFVEAILPSGCEPTISAGRQFKVIPPPPCGIPDRPTARAVATSDREVALLWDPVPGAAVYEIEVTVTMYGPNRSILSSERTITVVNGTGKNFEVPAVTAGNSLEETFKVRAIADCNQERGPFSLPVTVIKEGRSPIAIGNANTGKTARAEEESSTGLQFVFDRNTNSFGTTVASFVEKQIVPVVIPGLTSPVTVDVTSDQPWMTITPARITVPPAGTEITVSVDYSKLPVGASNAALTFTIVGAGKNAFSNHTTTVPTSVTLATPVAATPATAPPPNSIIVPAVAHAEGTNSTWLSDIRLTNVTPSVMKYQINFTPSNSDGTKTGKQSTIEVGPGLTLAVNDILATQFAGSGISGVLEIRPMNVSPSSFTSIVSSRTYNESGLGTFGQFIPGIPFSKFVGMSQPNKPSTTLSLQQIAQSADYRTNFGFVEAAGKPVNALLSVFSSNGTKVGEIPISLMAGEQKQMNSLLAANNISLADGRVEVKITSGDGRVSAYASVVDNRTNDPLLVPAVQLSAVNAAKYVIPGVADLESAAASWRTDLRLLNASTTAQTATLIFYPQENPSKSITKNVTLQPGQVAVLDDVLATTFGVTNVGGAVHVSTPNPTSLVATARTYDQQTDGTFGQFIPAITADEAIGLGQRPLQILQLEESKQFRANLGLAEVSGKAVTVEITAIVPDSTVAPKKTIQLQPNEFKQIPQIMKDLGLGTVYNGRISVKVINGSGKVTAYGSIIDNKTQDPTYVPAQ